VAGSIVLAVAGPKLGWSWTGARTLPPGDLGDPVSGTTGYQLCLYDGAAMLLMSADVPAGGQCGGSACWKALASENVRYKDATGASGGIVGMTLMPSAPRPGRIRVRGKGSYLGLPALPLASAAGVTVELRSRDDPTRCWAATFLASQRNSAKTFRARLAKTGG